jgi:hypothetical protein
MTLKKYVRWLLPFAFLFIFLATTASGCTDQAETDATSRNHDAINANLPIPDLTYSQRRWVLLQYYAQVLNKPILRTCTTITSRGGGGNGDILGIAQTLGMPVSLSNQVTAPGQSEPDSVYPGSGGAQTVFVLRNGRAMVSEADTTGITGDCPPTVHPNTLFQQVIDYQEALPPASPGDQNGVNFCPTDKHGKAVCPTQ